MQKIHHLSEGKNIMLAKMTACTSIRRIHSSESNQHRISSLLQGSLDLSVEDEDHGGANSTQSVGTSSLEECSGSLLLHDLGEAVHGALVHPLGLRLLGLHLQTTTHSVEWVGCIACAEGSGLGTCELDSNTLDAVVVCELRRDQANESVVDSEVCSTEWHNTDHGHTETVVETHETGWSLGSLDEAIGETLEGALARADIGGETGTGVIKRVDDCQGTGAGKTTGCHVHGEEAPEASLWAVLREPTLDGILEGKVERLCWEITQDVHKVSTPESGDSLLGCNTGEAVADSGVSGNLARDNAGVGILSLDDELHTLNRSSAGLGNGARGATSNEIDDKAAVASL